ncbi:MAG: hypothetical protein IPL36_11150 [Nigerium sp.]|nr:hypothetical protein [Nigerium sp.]
MSGDPSGLGRPGFLPPGAAPAPGPGSGSPPGAGGPGAVPASGSPAGAAYRPPAEPVAGAPSGVPHYPTQQYPPYPQQTPASAPGRRPLPTKVTFGLVALAAIVVLSVVFRIAAAVVGEPEPPRPVPVPVATAPRTLQPVRGPSLAPVPSPAPSTAWPTPNPRQPRADWRVVSSTREQVSYEVPDTPDWDPRPGLLVGYEANKSVLVIANTVSRYRYGACEAAADDRGYVGLQRSVEALGTSEAAAVVLATRWAQARDTEDDGTVHDVAPPTPRTIRSAGGTDIAVASVTFTPLVAPSTRECKAPAMRFTAAVLSQNGRHYPMVIVSDQGVPDALPIEVEDAIIATLLPAE